jgi:hypothetical protein
MTVVLDTGVTVIVAFVTVVVLTRVALDPG